MSRILLEVREFRQHFIVRLVVCVLLTWTAVDLLVPQLCSAEELSQASTSVPSGPTSQQHDDCFCCCAHVVSPVPFVAVMVNTETIDIDAVPAVDVATGVLRDVYHPPLQS